MATDLSLTSVLFQATDKDMNLLENRLKSFGDRWHLKESKTCNEVMMAKAGFYYCPTNEDSDLVRCYVCFKEMQGWEATDEPLKDHARSKSCAFIILNKTPDEFTVKDFLLLEKERTLNRIKKAVDVFKGKAEENLEQLLEEITM